MKLSSLIRRDLLNQAIYPRNNKLPVPDNSKVVRVYPLNSSSNLVQLGGQHLTS